ncbi:MAG: hypothetical protein JRI98_02750 [Deltaproteobacteria bacterium]|nr:hypothetical protein [Deltaproteobacteria bacterium]
MFGRATFDAGCRLANQLAVAVKNTAKAVAATSLCGLSAPTAPAAMKTMSDNGIAMAHPAARSRRELNAPPTSYRTKVCHCCSGARVNRPSLTKAVRSQGNAAVCVRKGVGAGRWASRQDTPSASMRYGNTGHTPSFITSQRLTKITTATLSSAVASAWAIGPNGSSASIPAPTSNESPTAKTGKVDICTARPAVSRCDMAAASSGVRRDSARLTDAVIALTDAKNQEPVTGQRVDNDGSTSSAPATAEVGSTKMAPKSVARR